MAASSPAPPSGVATNAVQPDSRWRSATEHDVYADNRDEDIFGWIQPDEWDTIAGPNKSNFMRGECVECAPEQDQCALVPSPLQSCGGPSCGYGAQCCEYSRRATHTSGPSIRTPALMLGGHAKASLSSRIEDLAKTEQRSSLGVSLIDIIHGRSCRPISLLDLRTFLHFQRQPQKRLPSYYPASDMQSSALDDFDLNLDMPTSPTASSPSSPQFVKEKPAKQAAQRLHYDEVDALDFLVAYERYLTKFRDQARADRLKSPDPATCKAAVRAYVRRAAKPRASSDLTAADVLLQGPHDADDLSDIPEEVSREVLARLRPADLGLKPESQPLRVEFDRLVHRYLCSRRDCILPSTRRPLKKRASNSSSDTTHNGGDSPLHQKLGSSKNDKMPRLRWMVDVGLISEGQLQLALAECDFSTHPDVLAPVAEAVYAYMSQHVVPFFFISVSRNLSSNTKRGRLLIGVVCTVIALTFSILLIVTPSPLAPRAHHGTGEISRWWRLLTAPLWCAGLGYILAYFTGLCVWLTLRGNREPDKEEEREREEIRSRISGEDVVGFDLAELQAAADERDRDAELEANPWMAPEIANILTGIAGSKKDKHGRQRSTSDVRGGRSTRALEEGRARSRSEIAADLPISAKASFDQSFADTSNAIALQPYTEKDAALTTPAAIILHTPRKQAGLPGTPESAGRTAVLLSAADLSAADSARPSMDRARPSFNDLRQTDAVSSANGGTIPAPAQMRQKRVPLLNFSIGITSKPGHELTDDRVDTPVLTRDALLFDPELAARVTSPGLHDASAARSTSGGSAHGSPPAIDRRKSLAHALLPPKSSSRMQAHLDDAEMAPHAGERFGVSDGEKDGITLPKIPEPIAIPPAELDGRDIAPWSARSAVSSNAPTSSRALLFSLPSTRRSRLSAATGTTVVSPLPNTPSAPKRAYDESPNASFKERVWKAIQRGTGFAVGTEKVLDARVRRAQQMKALRIMALNTIATVVAVVIVVAIP
ncbi:Inorganic pyrophosphatase-like protein [Pseudozyma hubeiensis]|nr:Inorganic pyrophosphatase-like protein [Pseudozyma hubeiensis]